MIATLLLLMIFKNEPFIRDMVCDNETRCANGVCATKWTCPHGITFVTSKKD
jgi:hypothetical protein